MILPVEVLEIILQNIAFEKVIGLSDYITKKLYNPEIHTWYWAAANGHLEVIKWLHENTNQNCTIWAMNRAAEFGRLEVVKWLHVNRTEGCSVDAMDKAAVNGHLEVVKWLHVNRTEGCSVDAMNWAVWNDDLEVSEWLYINWNSKSKLPS